MGFEERYDKMIGWLGFPAFLAGIWLLVCAVLLGAVVLNFFQPSWWLKLYLLMTLVMSAVEFIFYALDKRAATQDKRRIPERRLLIIAALCGWPGAVLGARLMNHKTVKPSYRAKILVIIFVHVAVLTLVVIAGLDN